MRRVRRDKSLADLFNLDAGVLTQTRSVVTDLITHLGFLKMPKFESILVPLGAWAGL